MNVSTLRFCYGPRLNFLAWCFTSCVDESYPHTAGGATRHAMDSRAQADRQGSERGEKSLCFPPRIGHCGGEITDRPPSPTLPKVNYPGRDAGLCPSWEDKWARWLRGVVSWPKRHASNAPPWCSTRRRTGSEPYPRHPYSRRRYQTCSG